MDEISLIPIFPSFHFGFSFSKKALKLEFLTISSEISSTNSLN